MEITAIEPFLAYWDGFRGRTRRVAECIPAEHIEWAPREGAFTFGDLLRHLGAIERWMFAENACGRPSRYPGHGRDLADGHDAVLAYLDAMHAEAMDVLRTLTPEALRAPATTPAGAAMPAWKWLRAMVEHEAHHRGQLYLMLNLLRVPTPPIFGLTEEEVHARSLGAAAGPV
jgi:uncharacterized damage-inducible protein DinB